MNKCVVVFISYLKSVVFFCYLEKICLVIMEYSECVSGCFRICKNVDILKCFVKCLLGCICFVEMWYDGEKCVK